MTLPRQAALGPGGRVTVERWRDGSLHLIFEGRELEFVEIAPAPPPTTTGERPVEKLAKLAGLSVANASQHLQQVRAAGLVASRRHGKFVLYRLADETVLTLLSSRSDPLCRCFYGQAALHFGSPSSRRRALNPRARSVAATSNDKTQ